jgi:hypothetical protein
MSLPVTSPFPLQRELATFERKKDELLAQGDGKYALIQGDRVCGVWDTYEDTLKAGYAEFGVTMPFLVKKISGLEFIHSFTRDLKICRLEPSRFIRRRLEMHRTP